MTLIGRVAELVGKHGGVRPAARVLKMDHGYLHRLLTGEKKEPSAAVLRKLGLRRVVTVTYVRIAAGGAK